MHRPLLAALLAVVPAAAFGQGAHDNIDALIEQQAKANGVPASFVHAVVKRESNYNPNAKGGSALGLMQIKHATARSLGYTGDAAGLLDPATNLRYGVAYLAGAYRTAQGNLSQAYHYYNRGYYYAAKRQGISTEVAAVVAPVAASASALASLFGGGAADTRGASPALAYAPAATAVAEVPTETGEVPLPPRRPSALGGSTIQLASLSLEPAAAPPAATAAPAEQAAATQAVEVPLPPRRPTGLGNAVAAGAGAAEFAELRLSPPQPAEAAAAAPVTQAAASAAAAPVTEAVEVPLPPRRPTIQMLAAATPRRAPAAATVREATALPVE